jgi:hypothetical protein
MLTAHSRIEFHRLSARKSLGACRSWCKMRTLHFLEKTHGISRKGKPFALHKLPGIYAGCSITRMDRRDGVRTH